jgi:hypothetical protein
MHYVRELWYVVTDRRHAKENTEARNELKERWMKSQRQLAHITRSRGRKLMPDCVTVRQRPLYGIKSSLKRWKKVQRRNVLANGQRTIAGYMDRIGSAPRKSTAADDYDPTAASPAATKRAAQPAAATAEQPGAVAPTGAVPKRQPSLTELLNRKRAQTSTDAEPASLTPPPTEHPPPLPPPEPPPEPSPDSRPP